MKIRVVPIIVGTISKRLEIKIRNLIKIKTVQTMADGALINMYTEEGIGDLKKLTFSLQNKRVNKQMHEIVCLTKKKKLRETQWIDRPRI